MCVFLVSSSVTNAMATLDTPDENGQYSIIVTCTIHPESTADLCVVMAKANGQPTREGNDCEHIIFSIHTYVHTCTLCILLCTYVYLY